MRKKITFILVVCAFLVNLKSYGQKNVVKLNLLSLPIRNFYASYERVLSDKKSISIGLAFMPSRSMLFKGSFSDNSSQGENRWESLTMSGFSVTPEFRFYTARRKEAPRGFYIAPYVKYQNFGVKGKYTEEYYDNDYKRDNTATFDLKGTYSLFALGCQFGVQWLISDRVSIDWSFIGIGVGSYNFLFKESSGQVGPTYYDDDNFSSDLEVLPGTVSVTSTRNSQEVKINTFFPHLRTGLSVGIAF